jgi:hypothetical protein
VQPGIATTDPAHRAVACPHVMVADALGEQSQRASKRSLPVLVMLLAASQTVVQVAAVWGKDARRGTVNRTQGRTASVLDSMKPHPHHDAAVGRTARRKLFDEELRLHERIVARDQSAVLEFLDRVGGVVYCMAVARTGDPTAAEDLTERFFLDLWREPERFHPAHGPVALQLIGRLGTELSDAG